MTRRSTSRAPALVVALAWSAATASIATMAVFDRRLDRVGRDDLQQLITADAPAFVPAAASALVVGSVLVLRRTRHPVGWLILGLGASVLLAGAAGSYGAYGAVARPGAMAGAALAAVLADVVFVVWLALLGLILLWTPTGRPPPGRWGWVAPATLVGATVTVLSSLFTEYEPDAPFDKVESPLAIVGSSPPLVAIRVAALAAVHIGVVAAALSLVRRFRSARGVERLQLRWVALAATTVPLLVLGAAFFAVVDQPGALAVFAGLFMAALPVATGLAIAQYHLYDVERLVSRAVTYVALSTAVVAVYVAVVFVVVATLGRVAGRSQVAAVVATLAAVSAIAPLRARVQRAVDRRFDRRQFDAVRVIERYVADPLPGSTVEDALRDAVGDPTLAVAYRIEDRERWVSEHGREVSPPQPDGIRASMDVVRRSATVARVSFDPGRVEPHLLERVVAEAGAELESARLRAAVALQLVEVQESRARIVAAQLAERRTIERNLHDGAQQRLLSVAMQLRAAELSRDPTRAREAIRGAVDEVQRAVAELRALANGLHPSILSDGGLAAALDDLAARIPVVVRLDATAGRFAPDVEAAAWYITCEAVANAVKHARPTTLDISARRLDGRLVVTITDDGIGGADASGSGLRGIADRAEAAGGRLELGAGPDGGTCVRVELPCES